MQLATTLDNKHLGLSSKLHCIFWLH